MPRKIRTILCFLMIGVFATTAFAEPVQPAKPTKPVKPAKPNGPAAASPPRNNDRAPHSFIVFKPQAEVKPESAPEAKQEPKPADSPEMRPLTVGDRGDMVKGVQKLLADAGFYPGEIDGKFGPVTQEAVKKVQRTYGLPVTGQADKTLISYLERARGKPDRYQRVMVMRATAYTTQDPGCTDFTYRGNRLRPGLAAVDPTVIPLGTRLYVEGYGYAVADDIGSAIKGHRIDLAFENRKDAFKFGVQTVKVYIYD